MIVHACLQGSDEWHRLRLGIPTASCFDRIITTKKAEPSAQAGAYMMDLLAELVLGRPIEKVSTSWMQRGNELEAEAVSYYEFQTDSETMPVGFVTNDAGTIGASPDRLVTKDLLLEAKCPSPGEHLAYVLGKSGVDAEYRVQLQGQLYITEAKTVDIISYHPHMPHAIVRVERDEEFIKKLSAELDKFVAILAAKRDELDRRGLLCKPSAEPDHGADFISDEDVERILEAQRV